MPLQWFLGPPGGLVAIPNPYRDVDRTRAKRAGVHELLGGGAVVDRWGGTRRYTLRWPAITDDQLSVLEYLFEMPGPMVLVDPSRTNLLTANQSHGTDALRSTEGFLVRTQGTLSSSGTFFRSGQRSCAWATGSNLSATDRGFTLRSSTTVGSTWCPVLPSTAYTVSAYMRTSSAVSMKAGMEWYDAAGAIIGSAVFGSGVALSTSNINTRVTHTATSPSTAVYMVPLFLNSTSPGTTLTVYLDEAQAEQASAVTAWVLGTGVPRVSLLELPSTTPEYPRETVELIAQELG